MSETLADKGNKGAEELTVIINGIFAVFLEIVKQYGGEIIHFSGDAISIIVYGDQLSDYKQRAAVIASIITDYIRDHNIIYTDDASFDISVHCGISSGPIDRRIIHYNERSSYIYYGNTMNRAAVLLDRADKGQIAIDESMADCRCTFVKRDGFMILNCVDMNIDQTTNGQHDMCNDAGRFIDPIIEEMSGNILLNAHRYITVIFVTIKPDRKYDRYRELLESYLSVIDRFKAYHDKFDFAHTGIKSMIILGAPHAMHDQELKALYLVNSIVKLFEDNDIDYQIGIHAGYAFCGTIGNDIRSEYTVMGDTVNTGARIMALAGHNEVLMSGTVYSAVNKHISLQNSKNIQLRGKQHSNEVFIFDGNIIPRMDDYWTQEAFIGRQREVDNVIEYMEQSIQGKVNSICIRGQSGSGKTMFIKQILGHIGGRAIPLVIRCREFNSKTPFAALWDILTVISSKRIECFADIPEHILSSIADDAVQCIETYDDSNQGRDETAILYSALTRILNQYFIEYPLIMIIDDYQWIDDSTAGFIDYYRNEMTRKSKLIILATAEDTDKAGYKSLVLKPFTHYETESLIINRYNSDEIARQITDIVYENSAGNPLIMNDMLVMLEERQCIESVDDHYTIHIDRIQSYLNNKTEAYLGSFMDSMDSKMRSMISVLSVFGDKCNDAEYKMLTGKTMVTNDLPRRHIICENGYISFRNDITRKAVYNILPFSFKEDIHYRILQLIGKEQIKRNNEFLISHLIHAGLHERALPLCIEEAEESKDICAYKTALYYYDMAIQCLPHVESPNKELLKLFRKDI